MDQKDLTGLNFINYLAPGLVTLSAVLIAALGARPALDSARPPVPRSEGVRRPESSSGLDALKARPWEDPLTAYEDIPNDDDAEAWQERAERRLPLIQEHYATRVKRELSSDKEADGKFDKSLCLFALVPSGSDSDAHETRLRIRYALTSALTEQGFSLSYPKRLTYFDINVPIYTRNPPHCLDQQKSEFEWMDRFQWNELNQRWSPRDMTFFDRFRTMLCGPRVSPPTLPSPHPDRLTTLRIPVKLYERASNPASLPSNRHVSQKNAVRRVLVFWIDEDRLGRAPLDALTRVYHSIFRNVIKSDKRQRDLHLSILGPTSSDILHLMNEELNVLAAPKSQPTDQSETPWNGNSPRDKACPENPAPTSQSKTCNIADRFGAERASLFSYRATAFSRQTDSIKCSLSYSPLSFCRFTEEAQKKLGLQVRTVIGNDLDLARELRDELKLRGAWPTKSDSSRRILLLTERDTNYGRNQQNVFTELIGRDASPDNVKIKTYLRGLDGIVPSSERFGQGSQQRSQRESDPDPDSDPSSLAPFSGSSQRDYIARLADELRRENAPWKRNGEQITAVGLLGSDVYDKLLLLRALRRCFPHAYFFTTDLDVELSHPSEKPFTHGLLIASHFGLQAGTLIQKNVPTFRDALQTSAYVAVFSAIKDSEERLTNYHTDLYRGNFTSDQDFDCKQEQEQEQKQKKANKDNREKEKIHPLLFQVGHSGPHLLPHVHHLTPISSCPDYKQGAPPRLKGPPLALHEVHATHQTLTLADLMPSVWWWICLTVLVVSMLILIAQVLPPWPDSAPFLTRLLELIQPEPRDFRHSSCPPTQHHHLSRPFAPMVVLALVLSVIFVFSEQVRDGALQQNLYFFFAFTILLLIVGLVPWVNRCIGSIFSSLCAFRGRNAQPDGQQECPQDLATWCVVGPLVIGIGLAILAALDHSQLLWQGDPVLLFEGISSWPITFIRALALTLSCLFCFVVCRRTGDNLQRSESVIFRAIPMPWTTPSLHDLRPIYVNVLVSLVVAACLFQLTDYPVVFFRGPVTELTGQTMLVFSVVFLLTLNFLIVHLIRDYYIQLRSLTKNQESDRNASPVEVDPGIFVHVPPVNVSEVLLKKMPFWAQSQLDAVRPESKEHVIIGFGVITAVQLIARQTDTIGKRLMLPAIVAIVLISARFPWLDSTGVPLTLLPLALFVLLFPFVYYFALRRTAQKFRNRCVRWLEHHAEERASDGDAASERVLRQQISQLYSTRWGVYRNWNDDWVFWALLIPLGGSSGLLLLERGASLFGWG